MTEVAARAPAGGATAGDWLLPLQAQGWVVVPQVPLDADNAALRALGERLGPVCWHGALPGMPNVEAHGVNAVQALARPVRDPAGQEVLSTGAQAFELHTDDCHSREPARWVLMHCWRADPHGGDSLLAAAEAIVAGLDAHSLALLARPDWATPAGRLPLLWRDPRGAWQLRCNRRDLEAHALRRGAPLPGPQRAALQALLDAAQAVLVRLRLAPGDCLVVDNRRLLHGRTAFDAASGRLLKRLRIA